MKPETQLIRDFVKAFNLYHLDMQSQYHMVRIESNYTQQGIPDMNLCWKGAECWIEFKEGKNKPEPLQISWIKHRRSSGGLVFIVTRYKEDHYTISHTFGCDHLTSSISRVIDFIINLMESRRNA